MIEGVCENRIGAEAGDSLVEKIHESYLHDNSLYIYYLILTTCINYIYESLKIKGGTM